MERTDETFKRNDAKRDLFLQIRCVVLIMVFLSEHLSLISHRDLIAQENPRCSTSSAGRTR
eukprot:754284-Hanusia_phi.AAC.2